MNVRGIMGMNPSLAMRNRNLDDSSINLENVQKQRQSVRAECADLH